MTKSGKPKRHDVACDWVRGDAILAEVLVAFELSDLADRRHADSACLAEIGEDLWTQIDDNRERRVKERPKKMKIDIDTELKRIDFSDTVNPMRFLCGLTDSWISKDQQSKILNWFAVHDIVPNMCLAVDAPPGKPFDYKERETMAKYLMGQALDSLSEGGLINPLFETKYLEWVKAHCEPKSLHG